MTDLRIWHAAAGPVSFVALMSCSVSFVNWGLSLVFGGLLARAIARRRDLSVDYRALGAAAFMGLGAVWALGMSSSAAQPCRAIRSTAAPSSVFRIDILSAAASLRRPARTGMSPAG